MNDLTEAWKQDSFAKIGIDVFHKGLPEQSDNDLKDADWSDPAIVGKFLRKKVEPWITALVQSEHLSLLIGTGMTAAVCAHAGIKSQGMGLPEISTLGDRVTSSAQDSAIKMNRGKANAEDVYRTAFELLKGLTIAGDKNATKLKTEINESLNQFLSGIATTESAFNHALIASDKAQHEKAEEAFLYLKSFLLSFSSRAASRDRLHTFTTNYDRFIEFAMDDAGLLWLDRFRGMLRPAFRNSRLELDFHYNPPGIRGEPRYVEGVARFTKLHGSIDWAFDRGDIYREPMPFGRASVAKEATDSVVIYPNSAKDMETAFYPYAELFRDFSTAVCRPNSVVVTYGYGFGDDHINRVLLEMLKIPSTHLLIISFDKADGRIEHFTKSCNMAQVSILLGKQFAQLDNLVDNYLPKPGIDRVTRKLAEIKENRSRAYEEKNNSQPSKQTESFKSMMES